jgi:hypothetical protein
MNRDSLRLQLERTRLERAIEVSESLADHRALLTTTELARLNGILTGKTHDPWRHESVTIELPSGQTKNLELMIDPVLTARDLLHKATETAESGNTLDAAVNIYVGLVLAHVFKDANRRTAALASHYFLKRHGATITGADLYELGLDDLRQPGQIENLRANVRQLCIFSEKKKISQLEK